MKNKKKFSAVKIFLIIASILLVIGLAFILYVNNVLYEMNEMVTVKGENITLTVKSIDTYTIENKDEDIGITSLTAGDYYKVEVEITNNGNEEYSRLISNFVLVDEDGDRTITAMGLLEEDVEDLLPDKIAPTQTVSGYVYFDRSLADNKYMDSPQYIHYESIATPGKLIVYPVKLY